MAREGEMERRGGKKRRREKGGGGERMKRKTKGMTNLQTMNLPYQRMLVLLRHIWAVQGW